MGVTLWGQTYIVEEHHAKVLLCFFNLAAHPLVLFFVHAHLVEKLLQNLALGHIEGLVLIGVIAEAGSFLALLSFSLSFLRRHCSFSLLS